MTMTDTEAKALALVNEWRERMGFLTTDICSTTDKEDWQQAAKLAIEREAATEARHAAELRELKERFSEVLGDIRRYAVGEQFQVVFDRLAAPFILPAPDPLVEVMNEMGFGMSKTAAEEFRAAMQARGYEWRKIGEAGE